MRHRLPVLIVAVLAVACASGSTEGTDDGSSSATIVEEEFASVRELDGYDAVRRLRPRWLRGRGASSFNRPGGLRVYVNGMSRGGVAELRRLRASNISQMRYLTGREATTRFGTDHVDGAILVTLIR